MKTLTLILMALFVMLRSLGAELFPTVDTSDYKGVIVSVESAKHDKFLASAYTNFWVPSAEQISKAEAKIAAFLSASNAKYASRQYKKLQWFRRQYVGYGKGDEKFILCNFVPGVKGGQDPFEGLGRSYLFSRDRGQDWWEIHYALGKDECHRFHVDEGY